MPINNYARSVTIPILYSIRGTSACPCAVRRQTSVMAVRPARHPTGRTRSQRAPGVRARGRPSRTAAAATPRPPATPVPWSARKPAVLRGMRWMRAFLARPGVLLNLGEQCVGCFYDVWRTDCDPDVCAAAAGYARETADRLMALLRDVAVFTEEHFAEVIGLVRYADLPGVVVAEDLLRRADQVYRYQYQYAAHPRSRRPLGLFENEVPGGGGGLLNRHQVGGVSRSPDGLFAQQEWEPIRGRPAVRGKRTYGGRPGQRVEEQGTWAAQKHSEAGYGRPVDRGVWTAKPVKRPRQQPAHPQYANYWAPLTRKQLTMPHSAQSQHANYWAPRTRKRHQQEHRPQRPTERSDPTQHAKGRTGDRPGPRKGATTRRNVTQGGAKGRISVYCSLIADASWRRMIFF